MPSYRLLNISNHILRHIIDNWLILTLLPIIELRSDNVFDVIDAKESLLREHNLIGFILAFIVDDVDVFL